MDDKLKALLGLDSLDAQLMDEEIAGMPTRRKLAQALRHAVETMHLEIITIQMPPDVALNLADDIDFAASVHPFGVPDDFLPPPLDTDNPLFP